MKYFQNPDNRYRVVEYYPTLQDLKQMSLQSLSNHEGYSSVIEYEMEKRGIKNALELLNDNKTFIEVLGSSELIFPRKISLGIQDTATGEIINRSYIGVYTYHPDEGYVIFHIQCERDLIWGVHQSFQIVSLKTGAEIGPNLVEYSISGIKDLMFSGIIAHSEFDFPFVYKIDEASQDIIEVYGISNETGFNNKIENIEAFSLSKPNWSDSDNYDIEFLDRGTPFFEDPEFLALVSENETLSKLIPKTIQEC